MVTFGILSHLSFERVDPLFKVACSQNTDQVEIVFNNILKRGSSDIQTWPNLSIHIDPILQTLELSEKLFETGPGIVDEQLKR